MGVHELDSLSEDQVDEVEDGHFVVLSGNIREAPITKFMRMKQHYNLSLQDMGLSLEDEDVSEEVIRTELEDASDIYQMSLGDSVDRKSVFRLPTDNMTGIEPRFPKEYKEYTVFGSVEHRYERGERQYHLSVFNEMNTKSRAEKNKRRRQLKRMASSASDFYEESIDDSIFYIEAPDIEINPIAVYF